jgi:hypothetical protein
MGEWMYRSTFSWPRTSWRWVVSFTPRLLYPRAKSPRHPLYWMGRRAGLDEVEKRKFLTLSGLEFRPFGRPARSQSLYQLRYPGSSDMKSTNSKNTAVVGFDLEPLNLLSRYGRKAKLKHLRAPVFKPSVSIVTHLSSRHNQISSIYTYIIQIKVPKRTFTWTATIYSLHMHTDFLWVITALLW